ncbi:hypothetical protein ATCC90586_008167 [Pythium insidiosum]|nr:hypothetical protein ATCC90586_008167 [Pythium insidiosum]
MPARDAPRVSASAQPTWTAATAFHTAAAVGVLGLGAAILLARKGTPTHRRMGQVWSAAMAATCLSSYSIREIDGSFSWIHGLSTYSLASLGVGIYQIRRKNVLAHKRAMQGLYAGAMVAGFFASAPGPAPSVDEWATGAYSVDVLDGVDEHATPQSSPSPARASLKRPGSGPSVPRSAKKKLRLSVPDDDDSVEVVTPTGTPQRKAARAARCSMHAQRVAEDDDDAAGSAADDDDGDAGKDPASAGKTSGGSSKPSPSPVAEAKAALLAAVSPRRRASSTSTPPAPAASGPAPGAAAAPAADGDTDDPASFVPDPEPAPPAHLVATPMKHGLTGAVYQSTVTVPVAPADEPVTDVVFRRVPYPQPLGTVRSQSRFLPVPDMDTKQRPVPPRARHS